MENLVHVTVEPREGISMDSLSDALLAVGAQNVKVLADGFVSAQLPESQFAAIDKIAHIHPKTEAQLA